MHHALPSCCSPLTVRHAHFRHGFAVGLLALCSLLTHVSATAAKDPIPAWTNLEGKTIQAEFIEVNDDKLIIRLRGKRFAVALNTLSPDSREQALNLSRRSEPAPPATRIEPTPSARPVPSQSPESSESAAEPKPKHPAEMTIAELWESLLGEPAIAAAAVLELAKRPDQTTEFLAGKLRPIRITREEVVELVTELSSDDQTTWQAASQKLTYYDPRLAMGLDELFALDAAQEFPARERLAKVFLGSIDIPDCAPNSKYTAVTLEKDDRQRSGVPGDSYILSVFIDGENALGLIVPGSLRDQKFVKDEWFRTMRALAVLESLGTAEATAIIEACSSGHPDAPPTTFAQQILADQR